ncbi:MAG TPA: T9SS type A sorting domain-containing protein [Bacteroides sp.]|nr:T9SS type A sorting domain-containing protein [Bacteroides sp.]
MFICDYIFANSNLMVRMRTFLSVKIVYRNNTLLLAVMLFAGLLFTRSGYVYCQANGESDSLELPLRGAFYYSWYPQTWTVGGKHVFYEPELGYYSSDDEKVVEQHIEDMDYAKIDIVIASWWGIDMQKESTRFPMLLDKTIEAGSNLKWAFYYEMEGFSNPTVEDLKSDLDYLTEKYLDHEAIARINGKPVIFVYNANDQSCDVADRWAEATNGKWYVNLKVFGGFRDCNNQPDSWHQYGPGTPTQQHKGYSFVISPGFWRADESTARLERDSARWNNNIQEMVSSKEPWQLVTTFNEWGEGTAIERCYDWQSQTNFGIYLDALHTDGIHEPVTTVKDVIYRSKVHFYHNPDLGLLTISKGVKMVDIYNINGSLLKRVNIRDQDSFKISTNELNSGVYFIKMNLLTGEIQTIKFIK